MSHLPVLYINLEKDFERRKRMEYQFQQLQINAQRLPAVWWNDLPASKQIDHHSSELTQRQYFKPMSNGEKGCYCSHLHAWQLLLESNAPSMAIFEDDVLLHPHLPQVLETIEQLPTGHWDMIKLYGRTQEKVRSHRPIDVAGYELITYQRVPSFAAGYIISRSGAQKMLESRIPFGRPVDVDIRFWFENGMRIFGIHPSVISLDETSQTSSIWEHKEPPLTLKQRQHKLRMKLQLTWGNTRARHPHVDEIR